MRDDFFFPLKKIKDFTQPVNHKFCRVSTFQRDPDGVQFFYSSSANHDLNHGKGCLPEKVLDGRTLHPNTKVCGMIQYGVA